MAYKIIIPRKKIIFKNSSKDKLNIWSPAKYWLWTFKI